MDYLYIMYGIIIKCTTLLITACEYHQPSEVIKADAMPIMIFIAFFNC